MAHSSFEGSWIACSTELHSGRRAAILDSWCSCWLAPFLAVFPCADPERALRGVRTVCMLLAMRRRSEMASEFERNRHSPSTDGDDHPLIVASVEECGYACYTGYV